MCTCCNEEAHFFLKILNFHLQPTYLKNVCQNPILKPSTFAHLVMNQLWEKIKCPCSGVKEHTKYDLVLSGCFYLYMSVADQLKCILEYFGLRNHIKSIEGKNNHGNVISDIYDSLMYAQFSERRNKQYGISLLGSTDGVVSFKTTNTALWPVQFTILELPPSERKKSLL